MGLLLIYCSHLSRGGRLQVRRYVVHHAGSREFGEEHNTLEGAHIACGLRGAPRPTVASSAPSPRAPPPRRVALFTPRAPRATPHAQGCAKRAFPTFSCFAF
ncbi:hypothetical protein RR46_12236 [Papilio xuthus]|uniref:Uncharacterized protein n=1 Tax=Papilio xuthus TaxID=66420 RepID=A0A194PPJ3_PAPXU|nr:hypothetical protein RR46_12236 [Papilio xuthus]